MSLPFLKLALRKPSLLRAAKIISTTGLATLTTGSTCYFLATRDQTFHHLDETTDPLALHPLTRSFNPHANKSLSDIYEARLPLSKIEPELLEDYRHGGSRLVERYCGGVLGGWGP